MARAPQSARPVHKRISMRTFAPTVLLTLAVSIPAFATTTTPAAGDSRSQSYITYDDGGTIVHSGDDGREIEARVNLPLYPGDEVVTNRRGRVEIRLSDGNVIGLDRSTGLRLKAMSNAYDGAESSDTVAELRFGHIVIQRTDSSREQLRIDSENASYVAIDEAIYAVEADGHGKDRVTVFEGTVEVRTPARTTRLRNGEEAHVDDNGVYGLVSSPRGTADDFERWFTKRAERYAGRDSRYLDRSLSYAEDDLAGNGSWIYVSGYGGWCWRPYVAAGWRPYYSGHWVNGRSGCLTWVSYENWGWVPYHYGRWAYDPLYGWVWLPGTGYAPAWVYWMYGSNYVGWAPAGWYDCYRPYYNWAYRPYHRADFGFGFYGRVRVTDIDLKPWTFVNPNTLISNRVDRAALTTDAVRERMKRGGGDGFATVSGNPARFSHNDLKDPATAIGTIARRGLGSGTGKEGSGSSTDMTPFFRRDPELSTAVRDRIVRTRPTDGSSRAAVSGGSGSTVMPIPNGPTGGGGSSLPSDGRISRDIGGGIRRGEPAMGSTNGATDRGTPNRDWRREGGTSTTTTPSPATTPETVSRPSREPGNATPTWRDRGGERVARPSGGDTVTRDDAPARVERPSSDEWRGRVSRPSGDTPRTTEPRSTAPSSAPSDIPRRIIDRIGGARSRPAESTPRDSAPPPRSTGSSSGSSGGSRDSGGSRQSSPPPQREHSAPAPQPQPQPRSNDNNSGSHHDGGEKKH
jgi:hypothetical protein